MAVYTPVDRQQLEEFLSGYPVGELVAFEGIRAGIVNSNFFVATRGGRHVLTLFETLSSGELDYFLSLTEHLAAHGIPCPAPIRDSSGNAHGILNQRPAALLVRLPGASVLAPGEVHCAAVGALLAQLHRAGRDFPQRRENAHGSEWRQRMCRELVGRLSPTESELLEWALRRAREIPALPGGVIHGDLFRDNLLFEDDAVSGVLDFYFACDEILLLDVAIAVNDWCALADGSLDAPRVRALLGAYAAGRMPGAAERNAWPDLLVAAALRFWLSRLYDRTFPRDSELVPERDPVEFRRLLAWQRDHREATQSLWDGIMSA
ncbi:MAG: homoserine kinase [Gammaproteobacteria bacterium]|nr:homoserine kinase [Gammaproteobacteria bacterium]